MFEAALEALPAVFSLDRLVFILAGVLVGVVVGALPGLGGIVGMSLLLPFLFGMDAYNGIALMMGMIATIHTSDTFPSVLLGAPGSAGSQATIMDGYPLARQGQASRALGAAFASSLLGGVLGAFTLFTMLSIARPLVLMLTSPRLFILGVFGLATVGTLVRGSALAGVVSATMGIFIGIIGPAIGAPTYRFTYDTIYLLDGVPLALIALGMFAIPEIIDLLVGGGSIAKTPLKRGGLLRGIRDVFSSKFLVVRSSIVGTAIGMIPGVGASVVDWVAYSFAQQAARDSSNFGKGDIRGVIAPESANNAKEGGALVPTILFGIPGTAVSAMLLGGLLLLGIQVGPSMVSTDLPVTLSIIWTLAWANVFAALACLALVIPIARITAVPATRVMPFLIVLIVIAAYQSTFMWGDLIALFALGLLGWLMKRAGWPRAPLLIGAVLAVNLERYLSISMGRYEFTWLADPFVIVVGLLSVTIVVLGLRKSTPSLEPETVASDEAKRGQDGD